MQLASWIIPLFLKIHVKFEPIMRTNDFNCHESFNISMK